MSNSVLCQIRDYLKQLLKIAKADNGIDYEIKSLPAVKYCDGGLVYQLIVCQKYEDGVLVSTSTIILDPNGNIITSLPSGATPCLDTPPCDPQIESFIGDNATLNEFDAITLFIPKCTSVTYTTSAGTVTLPAQMSDWIYEQKFDCPITGYSIITPLNITTILSKQ